MYKTLNRQYFLERPFPVRSSKRIKYNKYNILCYFEFVYDSDIRVFIILLSVIILIYYYTYTNKISVNSVHGVELVVTITYRRYHFSVIARDSDNIIY